MFSRNVSAIVTRYSHFEREVLVVNWVAIIFIYCLYGTDFEIALITGHFSLFYVHNQSHPSLDLRVSYYRCSKAHP